MTEIEKAIEILKLTSLDYQYPNGVYTETPTKMQKDSRRAISFAIQALEKQIPKKALGRHTNYKCSVCGRRVRSGKGSSSFSRDNFCQKCGQKLDWSEDNV